MSKFISNANVYTMAKNLKSYVEENGKLPYKYIFNNVEFTTNEMQDIMTYVLLNLGSNVNADAPQWCKSANGDNIVEDIYKEDYLNQAKRVHEYIIKNKQVPNNVKTYKSKKTVNIDLYTYCIAKILVFYKNNGKLPNYCTYNYKDLTGKPSKKKYGHATKSGCDNMGQNTDYYCACHSLQEVFRNLTGIVVSQSTIASVCGTTTSGTGHNGMNTCVEWFNRKYGKNLKYTWKNFSDLGWNGIKKIVDSNNQDCIIHNNYRNQWGHYETVNDVSNNINVQNSLGGYCGNGCRCGYIEYRTRREFESYINGISQKSIMVVTNG